MMTPDSLPTRLEDAALALEAVREAMDLVPDFFNFGPANPDPNPDRPPRFLTKLVVGAFFEDGRTVFADINCCSDPPPSDSLTAGFRIRVIRNYPTGLIDVVWKAGPDAEPVTIVEQGVVVVLRDAAELPPRHLTPQSDS